MNVIKLKNDIDFALDKWDEKSMLQISNVKRLTRSDIDTLLMCCDYYEEHGSLEGLTYFNNKVKAVLHKYGCNV